MFDQLTESNGNQHEEHGRKGYFIVTFLIVGALFLSGVVWSLYGKDLVLGSGDLELSTMISPVTPPENAPRPPQPKQERREVTETTAKVAVRHENILRPEESPKVPTTISSAPNTSKARTDNFVINRNVTEGNGVASLSQGSGRTGTGTGPGASDNKDPEGPSAIAEHIPEPPPAKSEPVVKKAPPVISGGVVNGKALELPKPVYSQAAKAIGAAGIVTVQVTIDESGNVISARAVSGHPLLKQAAERAAKDARFRPTMLSNQAVKVTGVITYNFNRS